MNLESLLAFLVVTLGSARRTEVERAPSAGGGEKDALPRAQRRYSVNTEALR